MQIIRVSEEKTRRLCRKAIIKEITEENPTPTLWYLRQKTEVFWVLNRIITTKVWKVSKWINI